MKPVALKRRRLVQRVQKLTRSYQSVPYGSSLHNKRLFAPQRDRLASKLKASRKHYAGYASGARYALRELKRLSKLNMS